MLRPYLLEELALSYAELPESNTIRFNKHAWDGSIRAGSQRQDFLALE